MRKLLILFLFPLLTNGQNYITNGDFEDCGGSASCPALPNPDDISQFSYINGYGSNWYNLGPVGGVDDQLGTPNGTVDWYKNGKVCVLLDQTNKSCFYNVNAESGNKFIGMADQEGALYHFSSPLPVGTYILTFWVRGVDFNSQLSSRGYWGGTVWINDDKIHRSTDKCDILSSNKIGEYTFADSDYNIWHKISMTVESRTQAVNYLLFTGLKGSTNCSELSYFLLDNIKLEKTCCIEEQRYQNTDVLPELTQRSNAIYAGENVSKFPQLLQGPVTVRSNKNVTFIAGNKIVLSPTGFKVEPGAHFFKAQIDDCSRHIENNAYDISLLHGSGIDYPTDYYRMDCDPTNLFHSLVFSSIGATHYRVLIFNIYSGGKVYEGSGEINDMETVFWDGSNSPNAPLSGVIEVDLYLFNCANQKEYLWEVNIEMNPSKCSGKKENTTSVISNITRDSSSVDFIVYPNPSNGIFTASFSLSNQSDVSMELIGSNGQLVSLDNLPQKQSYEKGNYQQKIDGANLPSGIYLLKLNRGGNIALKHISITNK